MNMHIESIEMSNACMMPHCFKNQYQHDIQMQLLDYPYFVHSGLPQVLASIAYDVNNDQMQLE